MKKYIKAKDVKKLYVGTSEFSLIDIREIGQHTDGHPFFSISIPNFRLSADNHNLRLVTSPKAQISDLSVNLRFEFW